MPLDQVDYVTELERLLREAYRRVPSRSLGSTRCTEVDPAGNTYEFTEYPWSVRIRQILGIDSEPQGW